MMTKELKEFVKRGGQGCPVCGPDAETRTDLTVYSVPFRYALETICSQCGAYWEAIYKLSEIDRFSADGPDPEVFEEVLDPEPQVKDEPSEEDLVTADYRHWYSPGYHRVQVETDPENWREEILAYMERQGFWPDCWFISDHGNAHLLSWDE